MSAPKHGNGRRTFWSSCLQRCKSSDRVAIYIYSLVPLLSMLVVTAGLAGVVVVDVHDDVLDERPGV